MIRYVLVLCITAKSIINVNAFTLPILASSIINQNAGSPSELNPPDELLNDDSSSCSTPGERIDLANKQIRALQRDGVLRINAALSPEMTDTFRYFIEDQKVLAWLQTEMEPEKSNAFYRVETKSETRIDLLLSLMRGGFAADYRNNVSASERHVLADALVELLGKDGKISDLVEMLVTKDGELVDMVSVITEPSSKVQPTILASVNCDTPSQPPLFGVSVALQDITKDMGPISFLLKSHTSSSKEELTIEGSVQSNDCRISTLKKGDIVIFDARIFHWMNENDGAKGSTNMLWNFSFQTSNDDDSGGGSDEEKDLGYQGSMRSGYWKSMTFGDFRNIILEYEEGDGDSFIKCGDGLLKEQGSDADSEEYYGDGILKGQMEEERQLEEEKLKNAADVEETE